MDYKMEFKKALLKDSKLLEKEISEYLLNYNNGYEVQLISGVLNIYLKDCSYFIESEYIEPSLYDDCLYTISNQDILDKIDAHINRSAYIKNYPNQLRHIYWKEKRQEIIINKENKCERCGTKEHLQVHHKQYIRGKLAWEYEDELLECLCGGCHMKHHADEIEDKKIKEKEDFITRLCFSPEENNLIIKHRTEIIKRMNDNYITSIVNTLAVHSVYGNRISFKHNRENYFHYLTNLQKQVIDPIGSYLSFDMSFLRKKYPL